MSVFRRELACWTGAATAVIFLLLGQDLMANLDQLTRYGLLVASYIVLIFD